MTHHWASTRQLVDEFKSRVVRGNEDPEVPLAALCTKNLRDLQPYGTELLDNLGAAIEAFAQNPSDDALAKSLEASLVAVYRFGLGWEDSLIQSRATELLQVCEVSCRATGADFLLRTTRLTLYQLALKLNTHQVVDIVLDAPKISRDGKDIEYNRQLDLASPRHLLVESDHVLDVLEDAASSVAMGARCFGALKGQLAGHPHAQLLSFEDLRHLSQSLVNSFVLLIPALRRNLDELDLEMDIPAPQIVDSLSWMARASFYERSQQHSPAQTGAEPSTDHEPIRAIKDLAWVGLAVLLDPRCSWADELGYERQQMVEYARTILREDLHLKRNDSNRVGLTFFLSAVDRSPLARHNWQQCLSKVVATMRNLAPSSKDMPPPGDCLAAAMAWWLRTPHEDALCEMQPPASPTILRQAFWGRITHPLVQSYLYRALQEQPK
jgi:hypothetical protein